MPAVGPWAYLPGRCPISSSSPPSSGSPGSSAASATRREGCFSAPGWPRFATSLPGCSPPRETAGPCSARWPSDFSLFGPPATRASSASPDLRAAPCAPPLGSSPNCAVGRWRTPTSGRRLRRPGEGSRRGWRRRPWRLRATRTGFSSWARSTRPGRSAWPRTPPAGAPCRRRRATSACWSWRASSPPRPRRSTSVWPWRRRPGGCWHAFPSCRRSSDAPRPPSPGYAGSSHSTSSRSGATSASSSPPPA